MTREIFQALETDPAVPSTLRQMLHIYRTNAERGTWPTAAREWQQVAEGVIEIKRYGPDDKTREFDDLYNHWLPIMGRHCINETKPSAPTVGAQGAQGRSDDLMNTVWQLRIMLTGLARTAQDSHDHVLRGSKLDRALQDIATQAVQATEKLNLLYPLERPVVLPSVQVFQDFVDVPMPAGQQGCMTRPGVIVAGGPGHQEDYISTPGDLQINEETLRPVDRTGPQGILGHQTVGLDWREEAKRWTQHPLYIAIQKHHADRGNDRCWENDVELYRAAGLEPGDPQLPSYEEHCRMCDKYRAGLYGPHTPPPAGNTLPS